MTDFQRILVVSTRAGADDLDRLRAGLGPTSIVLTAPTGEGKRVVQALGREALPEVVLAPVSHPDTDRGHRLDAVVRRHAVADRFRDVVVVADPGTLTLLLRVLAPDQLPTAGPVIEVGLPRGPRPVPVGWAVVGGVVLALAAGASSALVPFWLLPALAVLAGLLLLAVPRRRHIGQAVLIAIGVALLVTLLSLAGSARFPANW